MLQRYLTDCVQLALGEWDTEELIKDIKNSQQIVQSVVQCSIDLSVAFSELFPFARSSEASVCQEMPAVFSYENTTGFPRKQDINNAGYLMNKNVCVSSEQKGQSGVCQIAKNFSKPLTKQQLQGQLKGGFERQVGAHNNNKCAELNSSAGVGQLRAAKVFKNDSAFQRRESVGGGMQVVRQQSAGPTAKSKASMCMQRCISVPQTQTIRRGGDDFRIGSVQKKKDDEAPVKNLIAFFERQN